jgi:hypothetical protein
VTDLPAVQADSGRALPYHSALARTARVLLPRDGGVGERRPRHREVVLSRSVEERAMLLLLWLLGVPLGLVIIFWLTGII